MNNLAAPVNLHILFVHNVKLNLYSKAPLVLTLYF